MMAWVQGTVERRGNWSIAVLDDVVEASPNESGRSTTIHCRSKGSHVTDGSGSAC